MVRAFSFGMFTFKRISQLLLCKAGFATYDHTPMGRGYETFFGYFHHANGA